MASKQFPGNTEGFTLLPSGTSTSGTIATHRLVSTHTSLALAGIIGGISLGILAVWLLVVRTRKLKGNAASAGTSESSPLLVQYQAPLNLQVGSSMKFPHTQRSALIKEDE